MSTYNGEQYIEEQIDSILQQDCKEVNLLVRDDGSSDSTVNILQRYSEKYGNIVYYTGKNIGVAHSFFDLLAHVPDNAEYIAFSDQDDVWLKDKLTVAVRQLAGKEMPALYCCRPLLVDRDLKVLKDRIRIANPRPGFGNSMIENICTGCTIVFNRKLYDLIRGKHPRHYLIHDMWLYQVASCFGEVIYDCEPHILYRQHGSNAIGLDEGRIALIKRQIASFRRFRGKYTEQLMEFAEMFSVRGENRDMLEEVIGTRNHWSYRWKTLFDGRIYRQGFFDRFLFKGMLFWGML